MSTYPLPARAPGAPPVAGPPPAPSCATCPYAKPLHFAVYCALDEHVRNLPASVGHLFTPPTVQLVPPSWCPLASC